MSTLREAHCHLFQHGRALGMVQLKECQSGADVLDAFERAAQSSPGGPLLGHGARPEAWSDPSWPSLADFDRVTGPRPACAWCFDYHAMLANTPALRACGFTDASANPPSGVLGRSPTNRLSGVVFERAALLVWEAIPEPRPEQRGPMLAAALDDLARHGFGELHDLKSSTWLPRALAELNSRVRIELWPLIGDLAEVASDRNQWHTDTLTLGGGKVFVDGTLNSRTAAMLFPYADAPPAHPAGMLIMTEDDVAAAIEHADDHGLPIAAHAIGDRAVRTVLDALERVNPKARGHRIEHAELIDEADVPRIVELRESLGLAVSVQPCHLLTDIEALERGVPDRLDRVLPLRDLLDAGLEPGVDLLFGSDTPIVRPDPIDSIRAAVDRKRPDSSAIAPEQAINEAHARACFEAG